MLNNVESITKKYYLLSHPFMNKLISFPFNFYDEELVEVYISFIKSLALSINEETISFFFNSRFNDFPLFGIALKFYNHNDVMIRNAVRVITMTLFKMNDPSINELITDLPFCSYFVHLVSHFRDKVIAIDSAYIGA